MTLLSARGGAGTRLWVVRIPVNANCYLQIGFQPLRQPMAALQQTQQGPFQETCATYFPACPLGEDSSKLPTAQPESSISS